MTARRMCDLGHVSRAGLYRFDPKAEKPDDDLDLRDDIQRIEIGRASCRERVWR